MRRLDQLDSSGDFHNSLSVVRPTMYGFVSRSYWVRGFVGHFSLLHFSVVHSGCTVERLFFRQSLELARRFSHLYQSNMAESRCSSIEQQSMNEPVQENSFALSVLVLEKKRCSTLNKRNSRYSSQETKKSNGIVSAVRTTKSTVRNRFLNDSFVGDDREFV